MKLGICRNHNEDFKKIRNANLNQVAVETNNLIIRLDKLINRQFNNVLSKKDFEKSIVLWLPDSNIFNCRACNTKFSLTKRKHHCRLCGKIMCTNCSQFLLYKSAKKLIGPDWNSTFTFDNTSKLSFNSKKTQLFSINSTDSLQLMQNKTKNLFCKILKPRNNLNDNSTLNKADFNKNDDDSCDKLRICKICKKLLSRREAIMDLKSSQSFFVETYQKIWFLMTKISNLAPSYKHMAESINNSETLYTLEAANELRNKLINIQKEIISLCDSIEISLKTDNSLTNKNNEKKIVLQQNIKISVLNFFHDTILSIIELPSVEDYKKLVSKNKAIEVKQLEEEKNQKILQLNSSSLLNLPTVSLKKCQINLNLNNVLSVQNAEKKQNFKINQDNSWVSNSPFHQKNKNLENVLNINPNNETKNIENQTTNKKNDLQVLQQQYLNIKSYLEQATKAERYEEVEILEKSLIDLEIEIKKINLELLSI